MNNPILDFAMTCADQYGTYDVYGEFYRLDVCDLPDFVRHEFASLIIANDESYGIEATGADNRNWDAKMLPALTRYLANSTNADEAIEFNNTWRDCVTDHLTNRMQEVLDNLLCY